jgi:cysteine desulfurase/selenocysteine lyase
MITRTSVTEEAAAVGRRPVERPDMEKVRRDFPILQRRVHGKPLTYLDNAATSQKPQSVIDRLTSYYELENANIHRGLHFLSELATREYEAARGKVQRFLNAAEDREIIFVRGATEAINLVAQSYGRGRIDPGDEILISAMEHHANIVPWQMLCEQSGAVLRVVPITDEGELFVEEIPRMITSRTRMVAVTHVSNVLGTVNPVADIARMAHEHDVPLLVDGAQAAPHCGVDVQQLDCDFYAFSGHKTYGPTGIGILYGKAHLMEKMHPYQGGGDMIATVSFEKTTYKSIPYRFEAGTPHIAGAIGLAAAVDYVQSLGIANINAWEQEVLAYATERMAEVKGLRIIGTAREKAAVISFVMDGVHPHDIGTVLDQEGVAIRVGHHCAMPLMKRFGVPATARASFAVYNNRYDVDRLIAALHRVNEVFH